MKERQRRRVRRRATPVWAQVLGMLVLIGVIWVAIATFSPLESTLFGVGLVLIVVVMLVIGIVGPSRR